MEIDLERLISDVVTLSNHVHMNQTPSGVKRNLTNLVSYVSMLENLSGYSIDLDRIFFDGEGAARTYNKFRDRKYDDFYKYVKDNLPFILDMFYNYDRMMNDIPFEDYYSVRNFRRFSEKDFKDIVLSYYASCSESTYKKVKQLFDEKRVLVATNSAYNFSQYISSPTLESGYILCNYDELDTQSMTALVHELGHMLDYMNLYVTQGKTYSVADDALLEVASVGREYDFLNYLIQHKIDPISARILINNLVIETFDGYEYSSLLDGSGNVVLMEKSDFAKKTSEEDNEPDSEEEYDEESYTYFIDKEQFRLRILYALGNYFAFHLYEIKKQNPKEYEKIFHNLISTRKECKSILESIDKLGISSELFLSSRMIDEPIRTNSMELRKKFKY